MISNKVILLFLEIRGLQNHILKKKGGSIENEDTCSTSGSEDKEMTKIERKIHRDRGTLIPSKFMGFRDERYL